MNFHKESMRTIRLTRQIRVEKRVRIQINKIPAARGMFVANMVIPDIHQMIVVLSTRVKKPNETNWRFLARMIKYLIGTKKEYLTLSAGDLKVVTWYVDTSFAVHPDFKSHTKEVMTTKQVAIQSVSSTQKTSTGLVQTLN